MSNQQSKTTTTWLVFVVWTAVVIRIGLEDLSVVKLNSLQDLNIT